MSQYRQTEHPEMSYAGLETWPDARIMQAMIASQRLAVEAANNAAPIISEAATILALTLKKGGRMIYAGAGSSIGIGLLDGSEMLDTFGMETGRISYLIAGHNMSDILNQGSEDDAAQGARDALLCTAKDCLIALAASGTTPYTVAAAETAKAQGSIVIAIVNSPDTLLGKIADFEIYLDSGPEVIAGSTRLAAGTAQKIALNMLSTLANIKLHAVYDGLMVNVRPSNRKLQQRAIDIVSQVTGCSQAQAVNSLSSADFNIKQAILLCKGAKNALAAKSLLDKSEGDLRSALQALEPHPPVR